MKMRLLLATLGISVGLATSASALTTAFNFVRLADEFKEQTGIDNGVGGNGDGYEAEWSQAVSWWEDDGGLGNSYSGGNLDWWTGSGGDIGAVSVMAEAVAFNGTPEGFAHAFLDGASNHLDDQVVPPDTVDLSDPDAVEAWVDANKDAINARGPAGLGVCSTGYDDDGDISRCSSNFGTNGGSGTNNSGDDNISGDEILKLTFSEKVELGIGVITDSSHALLDTVIEIAIDGGGYKAYNVLQGVIQTGGDVLYGTAFFFTEQDELDKQIYIGAVTATAIPLPAGGLLLLGGLGVMGFARKRRKAS